MILELNKLLSRLFSEEQKSLAVKDLFKTHSSSRFTIIHFIVTFTTYKMAKIKKYICKR